MNISRQAEQLKEFAVGVEVFDRDEKYDPRLDSIVRVEAGRLRNRLDEYYSGEGANDQVRIVLPRGGYSAQFEVQGPPAIGPVAIAEIVKPARSWALWALVTVGTATVAAMAVWSFGERTRTGAPAIAVLAFEQYSSSGENESVAAQLTDGVTAELARLGTLSVVSYTSAMQFAGIRKPLREIAAALDADVILEGSVENEPDGIRVIARLVNARTDRKVWVEDFRGKATDLQDLNRRIAAAVSVAFVARRAAP